ncbi:hypothetical protein AB0I16_30095 [Streptomyces sp. NPDC050703]|uniref:hypothetical protein n=1 Tax=Streptomyces sp. NPDC050703 TaxID=3157218 RepID=UPI00343BC1AB
MRDYCNFVRPDTPFGSVTDPWKKSRQWLTGVSTLWAEAGGDEPPVLMGAALVVLPIHRTRACTVSAPLTQFGYRAMAADTVGENEVIVKVLDDALVQARRQAQVIAWHNGTDDLHVLQQLPRPATAPRTPGIAALAQAWRDRRTPERGTARNVDTGLDIGPTGFISDTAAAHGLEPRKEFAGDNQQTGAQLACEALLDGEDYPAPLTATSVLTSAVMTALVGGKGSGHLLWQQPLSVTDYVGAVAWDVAPFLFSGVAPPLNE